MTEHDAAVYECYVAILAAFASWLLDRGHRVLFFPTQTHADPWVIHDIQMVMKRIGVEGREDRILTPSVTSFEDLWTALSITEVVVASRFHGLIFSFLLGRPVLALSYYCKIEELMGTMGQQDYVLPIRRLDVDSLTRCFIAARARPDGDPRPDDRPAERAPGRPRIAVRGDHSVTQRRQLSGWPGPRR
jgi:polysaccharide pyruvyl transferase WcaK-like protein